MERRGGNEKNVIASCFSAKREADTFVMDGRCPLKLQLLLPLPSVRSLQLLLAAGNAEPTSVSGNPSKIIPSVIPYRDEITESSAAVNKLALSFNWSNLGEGILSVALSASFSLSLSDECNLRNNKYAQQVFVYICYIILYFICVK